jgi:ABC-type tungstate transport system permease subunit
MRKIRFHALALPLALVLLALAPSLAAADSSSTLTVVGTSDVSDSGLMQTLIQPAFEAAYPQYTFKYVGSATGAAISSAESGSGGASVLIVHAAALENQFVASGYSYNNQPGSAIFRNDFVLAGPSSDPAGVGSNGANNIAQAFADVAAAGYNNGGTSKVTFYDRLGSSGTTVQEHQIWALVDSSGLRPAGLVLCTLNAASGGGEAPLDPTYASTHSISNGQACPSSGAPPTASEVPSWYVTANITQAPNVQAADACTGTASGPGTCYVFTDRGTYDYLISGQDPAGSINGTSDSHPLGILTRDDSASAPGGANELINYFHAYIINPSSAGETVNLPAALAFVSLLTSPTIQAELKTYLDRTSDVGGSPFIADASPTLTETGLPKKASYGSYVTVKGALTNAEIGYPVLAGQTVTVDELEAGIPVTVASGKTDATGSYSIRFKPKTSGSYQVATGQLTQLENATLSPQYSDVLSPAATASVYVNVNGTPGAHSVSISRVSVRKGHPDRVTVTGTLKPGPALKGAKVELFALSTKNGRERKLGTVRVGARKTRFTVKGSLIAGSYVLQLEYLQTSQSNSFSKLRALTVR